MSPPLPTLGALSLLAQIAPAPYFDRFARVVGSQLGPDYVTQALALADQGYLWTLADLLEECRERDPHLHGVLQRREMRVSGAAWELRPPENSGDEGAEIARWCEEKLRAMAPNSDVGRSFAGMVADMMGAVYHGRSGHELVWAVERKDGREWWFPHTAEFIHPRRFAYATNWQLHVWDASGTGEDALYPVNVDSPFGRFPGVNVRDVNALAPGKFVAHCPRVMGTYPTREGIGRGCAWYSCFKRLGIREYVAFIAWAARGLRIGTFKRGGGEGKEAGDGASTEDEAQLRSALAIMSAQSGITIPDTCEVDIKTVPGEGKAQADFVAACNGEMSKMVFGSTLGTDVGSTGGNRALGEVHERGEQTVAKNDAAQVEDTVRLQVLLPMVRKTFGPTAHVPTIHFDVSGGVDLDALGKRMQLWHGMGGAIGAKSGANALGIPNLEDDEPLLKGVAPAPAQGDAKPADGSTPALATKEPPAGPQKTPATPEGDADETEEQAA